MVLLKKMKSLGSPLKGRVRDRKATEEALVCAAAKLFAEQGYDATRTLDIAKEAHSNEALILRYFGGKQGLLERVMEAVCGQPEFFKDSRYQEGEAELPADGQDLTEALSSFFKTQDRILSEKEEFMRIAVSRSLVDVDLSKKVRVKVLDERLPKMRESLKQYLGKEYSEEDLEALALLILSVGFSMNFLMKRIHRLSPKKVDRALGIFATLLGRA